MDISINYEYQGAVPVRLIFLWGMPGVGKSSLAKKVGAALSWKVVDADRLIADGAGCGIAEIFEHEGEEGFRKREARVIKQCLGMSETIVAVGGGAPCFEANAKAMLRHGLCIALTASPGFIAERLWHAQDERPLLAGHPHKQSLKQRVAEMLEERSPFYDRAHWSAAALDMDVASLVTRIHAIPKQ